jgi:hypothetical protein
MDRTAERLRELDAVIAGEDGTPLDGHSAPTARSRGPRRERFRLWSEAPLANYEAWLEIRARANFRDVEEERTLVSDLRARAPDLIKRVADFSMFPGDGGRGVHVSAMCEYLALNKRERRKADVWSHGVHISGNAWSAAALLPPCAVAYVLDKAKKSANQSARELLDALLECSPCLPASALRKDSRIWELLQEERGLERVKDYAASLGPLLDCNERAKRLLEELDEVERY